MPHGGDNETYIRAYVRFISLSDTNLHNAWILKYGPLNAYLLLLFLMLRFVVSVGHRD